MNYWDRTIYSLFGKLMDVYGANMEWYCQRKKIYKEKIYKIWVIDEWMCMEQT